MCQKAHRDTLKDLSEEVYTYFMLEDYNSNLQLERVTNATLAESDMSIENLEITITEKNKANICLPILIKLCNE